MSTLPTQFTIRYGSWTFPVETETAGLELRPTEDAAGRTNTGNRYAIRLKSYLQSQSQGGMDTQLAALRRELTTYGQQLVYQPNTTGGITINVGGGKKDLAFGPKPKLLSLKPVAGNLCWEYTWEVEFQTTDCTLSYFDFAVREFNFEVEFEMQGKLRLTARRYSGHLVIPQTRTNGGRDLSDNADRYFEKVVPPVPLGFRRDGESRRVSLDKNRLDFNFTDTMLPEALPVGCVAVEVERWRNNQQPGVFNVWQGMISATYTVAMNWPRDMAFEHFKQLMVAELVEVQQAIEAGSPNPGSQNPIGGAGKVIPLTMNIRDNVNTREVQCNLTWSATSSVTGFLTAGLWRPLAPNATHQLWARSMALHNRPRGWSGEVMQPSEDTIIDLCLRRASTTSMRSRPLPQATQGTETSLRTRCPPEELSWLWYECRDVEEDDDGVVIHRPLPRSLSGGPGGVGVPPGLPPSRADLANPPNVVQRVKAPALYVHLVGKAARACYPIPRPDLKVYKGQKVQRCNRRGKEYFVQEIAGNVGQPIYTAVWDQRFMVLRDPGPSQSTMRPGDLPDNPVIPKGETSLKTNGNQLDGNQLPDLGDLQ